MNFIEELKMRNNVKTIWKYPVTPGPFALDMPQGSKVLTAQLMEQENVYLWASIRDTDAPMERRYFVASGTGHAIAHAVKRYISTFQIPNEWNLLVFHLFEVETPSDPTNFPVRQLK